MKSLYIVGYGSPNVLQVREEPTPTPTGDQVLIRVRRAGLNFAEIMARLGLYQDAPKPPMVMGYEVAGEVVSTGPTVRALSKGTQVLALTELRGQATHALVSEHQALPIPQGMSDDEAAALPVNYLTAFHMLHRVAHLRAGSRVLIHMAAGGVGIAAIQLCRTFDNIELFGTASASKHPLLRELGVDHPIDYRSVDYFEQVMDLTQGAGVDLVLDPLGGRDWTKGYRLLRPTGHLIMFGWANMASGQRRNLPRVIAEFMQMKRFSPMALMLDNKSVSGVNMGRLWSERALMLGALTELLSLYQSKRIAPRVDKIFKLDQAADAHRYVQERRNVGKVLFDCE